MNTNKLNKYRPFTEVKLPNRTWPDRTLARAPIWCSVDLRDGNQALSTPMNVAEKLEMFKLLVDIGFKQIEIGFPSASQIEFNFIRMLIEKKLIPDDVTIQVLVQAREPLIRRTFESLKGAKQAIVHMYNSTSPLQRKITFRNASREDIKKIAVEGTKLVKKFSDKTEGTKIFYQYSPESFSDTELDFSLEICEAVKEIWQPNKDEKIILNLPATVEWATPNVHADQIEWFCQNISEREKVIISLHTHNDRGTGVAATELGMLAGADRVEGTLFGNGERTGNLDIVTCSLNLNSHGIKTGLDFSRMPEVRNIYERCTRMTVHERHPYAGDLVFTAFSGSHQDAIKKGMDARKTYNEQDTSTESEPRWEVPYLMIDPEDIGRSYEAIIRINSQSGKGGVAYIMDSEFGLELPKAMHPQVGKIINDTADKLEKELSFEEIGDIFFQNFVNLKNPLKLINYELYHNKNKKSVKCEAKIEFNRKEINIVGTGNGPINSFVHALKSTEAIDNKDFKVIDYRSHAVRKGSDADSAAYVCLESPPQAGSSQAENQVWGCGINSSIEMAGLSALISAFNRLH